MVVMNEAVVIMMFAALWALGGYALFQRLFVVRKLRRKLEAMAELRLSSQPAGAALASDERADYQRIQQRLEVLERIAVEKENSLAREIESLRATG